MTTISACMAVRDVVQLGLPLDESIASVYPVCDDFVLAYDRDSEDGTEECVRRVALRFPRVRLLPGTWDARDPWAEFVVRSNEAVDACTGEWVLFVRPDEILPETEHLAIRTVIKNDQVNGVLFDLWPQDNASERGLLRLFRRRRARVAAGGMTCAFAPGVPRLIHHQSCRLVHFRPVVNPERVSQGLSWSRRIG